MEITLILSSFVIILSIFYFYLKSFYNYWENRGVAYIKPRFGFGNVQGVGIKRHFYEVIESSYRELKPKGRFGGMFLFFKPIALITDLELIKTILIKEFNNFPNRGIYYNEKDDPLSAHLVNIEDDRWRKLRQKLTPTFTSGKIKMMFDIIGQNVDNLVLKIDKEISKQESVDMKDIFGRFTTDVIASCAFGIDSNSLNDSESEFFKMGQKAFEVKGTFNRFLRFTCPDLGKKFGLRLLEKSMTDFYQNITQNTIDFREKNGIVRNDFMSLLIKMKNSSGDDRLTLNEIAAQSLIFYVAGHETTATTLTYCIYELSKNIQVQEKARNYVIEEMKKCDGKLSYETVSEMHYLEQIINETLRMYPPAATTSRVAKKDYLVPETDKIIENGTLVSIPIHAIHHDPEIYSDPNKFDPDRFSPQEVSKRHPCSFMPFGEGPRICIGLRFAMTEAKFALAKLLLGYSFKLDTDKMTDVIKPSLKKALLQPSTGVFIKVKKL